MLKKNNIAIFLLSIVSLMYYINFGYSIYLVLLIILGIYILYKLFIYKLKQKYFILLFILINLIMILLEGFNKDVTYLVLIIYILEYIVFSYLIIFFLQQGEEMAKLHSTFKDIEQEEQMRLSIFKITHEIKNPIAVCKGYLDMFDTNNIEHSKKYVPIIRSEINRTLCLLQDFLELRKI